MSDDGMRWWEWALFGIGLLGVILAMADATPAESQTCSWATAKTLYCCTNHDRAYTQGGTERDRELADAVLKHCLRLEGADDPLIDAVYTSARRFGATDFRYRGGGSGAK